jgi:Peptidase family M23
MPAGMWSPPGQPAPAEAWNFSIGKKTRWVGPGVQAPPGETQFSLPPGAEPPSGGEGYHVMHSPPGIEAPRGLINYTPKTGEVHAPGARAPVEHLNLSLVPEQRPRWQPPQVGRGQDVGVGADEEDSYIPDPSILGAAGGAPPAAAPPPAAASPTGLNPYGTVGEPAYSEANPPPVVAPQPPAAAPPPAPAPRAPDGEWKFDDGRPAPARAPGAKYYVNGVPYDGFLQANTGTPRKGSGQAIRVGDAQYIGGVFAGIVTGHDANGEPKIAKPPAAPKPPPKDTTHPTVTDDQGTHVWHEDPNDPSGQGGHYVLAAGMPPATPKNTTAIRRGSDGMDYVVTLGPDGKMVGPAVATGTGEGLKNTSQIRPGPSGDVLVVTDSQGRLVSQTDLRTGEPAKPERETRNGITYERDPQTGKWKPAEGLPEETKPETLDWIGRKPYYVDPRTGKRTPATDLPEKPLDYGFREEGRELLATDPETGETHAVYRKPQEIEHVGHEWLIPAGETLHEQTLDTSTGALGWRDVTAPGTYDPGGELHPQWSSQAARAAGGAAPAASTPLPALSAPQAPGRPGLDETPIITTPEGEHRWSFPIQPSTAGELPAEEGTAGEPSPDVGEGQDDEPAPWERAWSMLPRPNPAIDEIVGPVQREASRWLPVATGLATGLGRRWGVGQDENSHVEERPGQRWVPPVDPSNVKGTGHRFGEPVSQEGTHKGVDLQAVRGTPTKSPVDGVVVRVESNPRGLGTTVTIRDARGHEHTLGHLDRVTVRQGERVRAGQPVATVGSTGAATGPHLDVREQRPDGQWVNPASKLGALAQLPRADGPPSLAGGGGGVNVGAWQKQMLSPDMFGAGQSEMESWQVPGAEMDRPSEFGVGQGSPLPMPMGLPSGGPPPGSSVGPPGGGPPGPPGPPGQKKPRAPAGGGGGNKLTISGSAAEIRALLGGTPPPASSPVGLPPRLPSSAGAVPPGGPALGAGMPPPGGPPPPPGGVPPVGGPPPPVGAGQATRSRTLGWWNPYLGVGQDDVPPPDAPPPEEAPPPDTPGADTTAFAGAGDTAGFPSSFRFSQVPADTGDQGGGVGPTTVPDQTPAATTDQQPAGWTPAAAAAAPWTPAAPAGGGGGGGPTRTAALDEETRQNLLRQQQEVNETHRNNLALNDQARINEENRHAENMATAQSNAARDAETARHDQAQEQIDRDRYAMEDRRLRDLDALKRQFDIWAQREKERFDIAQSALKNPWLQRLSGLAPQWGEPGGPQTAMGDMSAAWSPMVAQGTGGGIGGQLAQGTPMGAWSPQTSWNTATPGMTGPPLGTGPIDFRKLPGGQQPGGGPIDFRMGGPPGVGQDEGRWRPPNVGMGFRSAPVGVGQARPGSAIDRAQRLAAWGRPTPGTQVRYNAPGPTSPNDTAPGTLVTDPGTLGGYYQGATQNFGYGPGQGSQSITGTRGVEITGFDPATGQLTFGWKSLTDKPRLVFGLHRTDESGRDLGGVGDITGGITEGTQGRTGWGSSPYLRGGAGTGQYSLQGAQIDPNARYYFQTVLPEEGGSADKMYFTGSELLALQNRGGQAGGAAGGQPQGGPTPGSYYSVGPDGHVYLTNPDGSLGPDTGQTSQAPAGSTAWTSGQLVSYQPWDPQAWATKQQHPSWQQFEEETPFQRAAWRTKAEAAGPGAFEALGDQLRKEWAQSGGPTAAPSVTQMQYGSAGPMGQESLGQVSEFFGEGPQNYLGRQQRTWSTAQAPQVSVKA